jgi:GT2 family glycosyltransferase
VNAAEAAVLRRKIHDGMPRVFGVTQADGTLEAICLAVRAKVGQSERARQLDSSVPPSARWSLKVQEHYRLTVSVVTYGSDLESLGSTLMSLLSALRGIEAAGTPAARLFLVDNGPPTAGRTERLTQLLAPVTNAELISGVGNLGYGRGHNLAIQRAASDYHLVLNPDVELREDALCEALAFMDAHPECGLLAPAVHDMSGTLQYLCKRQPAVLDLLLRGFAPPCLRKRFRGRLARYEMRDCINEEDSVWDPPMVSGCFMLFRADLFQRLGGFDPRYFLYFEDFDVSLRMARIARLAYVPRVRIVHHGGGASRKGLAHVRMFASSAIKFYVRHGWRWA